MGGDGQSPEVAALTEPVDLSQRIVYFPVRHHSPGCAWHVDRLIRRLKPKAVLIEGPRDASPLIPLLLDEQTRMPVAIYTTYVRRRKDLPPDRHGAYYPLCDHSPELAAARAGVTVGAAVRFIDLTFPEKVEVEERRQEKEPTRSMVSLQAESWFSHSRLLRSACIRTGARDADDLWDHLYEVDYREKSTEDFASSVLAYCRLARQDASADRLAADGTLAREQAMADEIAREQDRVVVVTGGFHTVVLPETRGKAPKRLKVAPDDALTVLMRYSFEQLDRLNGYASGMPSPEFYQRQWEERQPAEILVEIARRCRRAGLGISTADSIAAVAHVERLAMLRGHTIPSREDVLDGVRSVFIKGADDTEGVPVLAIARKLLAGERIGNVPAKAGQPPIVHDFRNTAAQLKLKLDRAETTEATLDLYRKRAHRDVSRLFHRLAFLKVPFATFLRGPDFVSGEQLDRIQEVWKYCWSPQTESTLIERSLYGSTIEEAANSRLLELFQEAEGHGESRNAALATQLVLQACRMGLHRHSLDLLSRVGRLVSEDSAFDSLVTAMENLLVLEVSREPLEAHHLTGLDDLARAAYHRACYLIPSLVSIAPEEEAAMLDGLNALFQAVGTLGDTPELRQIRSEALRALAQSTGGSAAMRGGSVGLLHGDGQLDDEELAARLRGHMLSSRHDGTDGPDFLRGLLKTARTALWQISGVLECVTEVLGQWEEDRFVKMLPLLRLALSDLTPRETDHVAREVAALLGSESLAVPHLADVGAEEMLRAVEVNRLVRETLKADGLEALCE